MMGFLFWYPRRYLHGDLGIRAGTYMGVCGCQRADPATRTVSIEELSEKTAFKKEDIKVRPRFLGPVFSTHFFSFFLF